MLIVETRTGKSRIHGRGCFAAAPIPEGTVVWVFDPEVDVRIRKETVGRLSPMARRVIKFYAPIEDGVYTLSLDNSRYINHSKSPNLVAESSTSPMRAVRDIEEGEELTVDYGDIHETRRGL